MACKKYKVKCNCASCKSKRDKTNNHSEYCNCGFCTGKERGIKPSKIVSKTKLHYLYIEKSLSAKDVAKELNVTKRTILNWLNKLEIKERHSNKGRCVSFWKDKHLSEEVKLKISISRIKSGVAKGEKNPNYKNGLSLSPYSSDFDNKRKREVFKRDNFTCQLCNKYPTNKLDAHHIDYNKLNSVMNNLITLCHGCHMKTNHNREYWKDYFKNKIKEIQKYVN